MLVAGSCDALHVVDARQQLGDGLDAGVDRLADAAALLDASAPAACFFEPSSWIRPSPSIRWIAWPGLAAEADEDVGGDVGVLGEAGQRAVELVVVGAVVLHGAAGLVRDRRRRRRRSGTASSRSVARNRSEMYLLVLAEQLTVLMMAM